MSELLNNIEHVNVCRDLPVSRAIFIPLSEIECRKNTFTRFYRGNKIKLIPKNGILHGLRCKEAKDEQTCIEHCGKIEPKPWMGRLVLKTKSFNGNYIFQKYPKDIVGWMEKQHIGCIALFPCDVSSENNFVVIGNTTTTIRFLHGNSAAMEWPEDVVGLELSTYQPLPIINYHGQVSIHDCSAKKLINILDKLITQ